MLRRNNMKLNKKFLSRVLTVSTILSGVIAPLSTQVLAAQEWVHEPGAQAWEGTMYDENGNVAWSHEERPLDKNNLQKPMTVQGIKKLDNGVKLNLGAQEAYIRLLSSDISKFSLINKGEKEYTSVGIAKTDWATPKFEMKEDAEKIVLKTDSLTVHIKKSPFGVKYLDKDGSVINEDAEQGLGYENGKPYLFKKTDKNEDFYGFGQKVTGLNHRGKDIGVWHRETLPTYDSKWTFSSVPFFIGLKGSKAYGILFDNTFRSYYDMAEESDDYLYFYADGGKLTYYFFNGPQMNDVVDRYTDLTGKMQMPPEWSMGFHQASWGYHQKDVEQVAQTYRDKKIPIDSVWLDIEWMNDYKSFEYGEKFADPDGLEKKFNSLNLQQVAIIDPAIRVPKPGEPYYRAYTEGSEKDLWVKNPDGTPYQGKVWPWGVPSLSVFPNFYKEETREWWADQHKEMFNKGVDGIWNDMNEPANFSTKDYWTLPLDTVFETDDGQKLTHEEAHNTYAHLENQATDLAFKKLKPNVRPFILTRASFTGTARYATATWTGDNWSGWEHLRMTISQNANVGLTGFAMVGNDIGGFAKNPTPNWLMPDVRMPNPELFARWVEVGAFYPFSRDHYNNGGKSPIDTDITGEIPWQRQEPWQFGKEVEDISRKYISMRYELMPYLYNAFQNAHEDGELVMQPLVYQFQKDEKTHDIQDQFMFGDSMMMAPVVHQGATSRDVYLPADAKWVDYWTGKEYEGGQTINKQANLGTLPIYVKKDSIIPRRELQQYTGEKPLTNLILDTYLENEASYNFYEDDGSSENYKKGEYNETVFHIEKNGNHIEFEQDKKTQNYKSDIQSYTLQLHNAEEPKKVQAADNKYEKVSSVDALNNKESGYYFDSKANILYVKVPVGENHKVKVQ